jgi:predicted outer membrane repeat protein
MTHVNISSNRAGDDGGGVYISDAVRADLNQTILQGNAAGKYGGGVTAHESAKLALRHCHIANNTAKRTAGALDLSDQTSATVVACECSGNTANKGGFMDLTETASASITDTNLFNNTATSLGGAIYAEDTTAVDIKHSNVTGDGRATATDGAAVNVDHHARVNLTSCTISNFRADQGAGLVVFNSSTVRAENCTLANLTATNYGAGLTVSGSSTAIWLGGRFVNVSAPAGGVASVWGNASFTAHHTAVMNASSSSADASGASAGGGGAFILEGSARTRFTSCTFHDCVSKLSGGAFVVKDKAHAHFTDCTFSRCKAAKAAGAIGILDNATVVVQQCRLQHNTAAAYGGAVALEATARFEAFRTSIVNNSAAAGGGGITGNNQVHINLTQCVFYANSGLEGGAIYLDGNASLRMPGTHVVGNQARIAAGGVFIDSSNFVPEQLTPAMVHGNKAPLVANVAVTPTKLISINDTLVSGFVSRLGADDGLVNVTLKATGPHNQPAEGYDVMALVNGSDKTVSVLDTRKTGRDGKVRLPLKLRRSPGGNTAKRCMGFEGCTCTFDKRGECTAAARNR